LQTNNDRQLDAVAAAVAYARPYLVDGVDAAIALESLGYTDARARRELGVNDVYSLGQLVFTRLSERPLPVTVGASTRDDLLRSDRREVRWPTLPYAAALIGAAVIDAIGLVAGPPVQIALMTSLIVVGGFVLALRHRARFYADLQQPALATSVAGYVFRLGAIGVVAAAAAGLAGGWAFGVAPWPVLVLWADEFIIVSVLWLAWAAWGMRRASRQRAPAIESTRALLPLPRLTVVFWQMLPWIAYGTVCCAVAFAGPLLARDAATRAWWSAGATAFLLAIGTAQRVLRPSMQRNIRPEPARSPAGMTMVTCAATGAATTAVSLSFASGLTASIVVTIGLILIGYVMAAAGAANASRLFLLDHPWAAVRTFATGLGIFLAAAAFVPAAIAGMAIPAAFAVAAGTIAVVSTSAVRRAVQAAPMMSGGSAGSAGVSSPTTRQSMSDVYADL
jgi:hypothetical protein